MSAPLIRPLPQGAIDIVGDVHGEIEALDDLLTCLGYDADGYHRSGRHVVFVGDLIDRGPDSPQVLQRVARMMAAGHASAILGNHELNLLAGDAKDGSGWYFASQREHDRPRYQDYVQAAATEKVAIADFLNTLPLILERADVRIVHAAWLPECIDVVRGLGDIGAREAYAAFEAQTEDAVRHQSWYDDYRAQLPAYRGYSRDKTHSMPHLPAVCAYDLFRSRHNPLRTLSCGSERRADKPFYAAGRWRFTTRERWWAHYRDTVPVVMGHYWRSWRTREDARADLFPEAGDAWLGGRNNVFCVDFSVGARWRNRLPATRNKGVYRLAALRWPEKILMFDDGTTAATRQGG